MTWAAYPAYRDSRVQWLGALPEQWEVRNPKTLFVRHREPAYEGDRQLTASQADGVVYQDEFMEGRGARVVQVIEGQAGLKHVSAGDFVISLRSFQGGIEFSAVSGKISPAYTVLTPRPEAHKPYFTYLLKSQGFIQELRSTSNQLRDGQSLGMEHFAQVPVPLPPLDEQAAIAQVLDVETAKIDALIVKQERLMATLREDRTATITDSVTNGLDPTVDMVQPHNSELPVCPEHWTPQISLKRLAEVQTGLTLGKSVDPVEAVDVPYLRVANVQTSGVKLDEVKTVAVHRSELSRYLLRNGDVLMTEGGDIDKLGRGCLWSGEITPCIHQNHVFAVRCNDTLSSAFLVYLLDTAVARNYFFMTAKKTTNLASTNSTTLGAFTFSLPPRAEQDEIVGHLDERCAGLDALINKANAVIEVLREYRAALITDAVTGKIDVRGAVA